MGVQSYSSVFNDADSLHSDDFRLTACINLLKWVKQHCELKAIRAKNNNNDTEEAEPDAQTDKTQGEILKCVNGGGGKIKGVDKSNITLELGILPSEKRQNM